MSTQDPWELLRRAKLHIGICMRSCLICRDIDAALTEHEREEEKKR